VQNEICRAEFYGTLTLSAVPVFPENRGFVSNAVAGVVLPLGVSLREMTTEDIPAGLQLCRASRWNQVARDWEQFLRLEPHGAAVAVRDGRVIGSVATLRFSQRFAWIAMVLVDPAERGHGIGRALLLHGLSRLNDTVARLDATPAGEVLYRKLEFEEEYRLTRFQRPPGALDEPALRQRGTPVSPLGAEDWPAVFALDTQVFGADRKDMLTWLAEGAPEYAWVSLSTRGIDGFLLGRHGHHFEHLGPVIARDGETARRLVAACVARYRDRGFILDAPDQQTAWQTFLQEAGFVVQRPFIRMFRGDHRHPGLPERLFASIGPEFG
jgi:predicted N-acetyltransferase YhbS